MLDHFLEWISILIYNYPISIGNTTNVPDGTYFAAGDVLIGQDDITLVRNINATGIITGGTADFTSYTDLRLLVLLYSYLI